MLQFTWSAVAIAVAQLGAMPAHARSAQTETDNVSRDASARLKTAPKSSANIFFSGHSLTDNPLPDDVAMIARSLGSPIRWNQQNIPGSSIQRRTRGSDPAAGAWAGYRTGKNREGEGMDVLRELREPATLDGARYDTLVITEGHWLVDSLRSEDTVRHLRHFHDRFIDANPNGRTHFYASWIDLYDKADPDGWIAYERAAAPVWACVAAKINESLAVEGRSDRVVPLPAALALAGLVERATQRPGIAGITRSNIADTVGSLFKDEVHLTRLGVYYMALVTYAYLHGQSPRGAWAPSEVTDIQARALQDVAWEIVLASPATDNKLGELQRCRTYMRDSFCGVYYSYMRRTYWSNPRSPYYRGPLSAHLKQLKETIGCRLAFGGGGSGNPFLMNPEDRSYWYPAP